MLGRLIWTSLGALIGAYSGAGTGIVGAFGGVAGLLVFTVIGGVIGFFAASDISRFAKRTVRMFRKG